MRISIHLPAAPILEVYAKGSFLGEQWSAFANLGISCLSNT